uniref:Major basic nuclear protein variant n=1 Tax=Amphidinium carterae TaxID=2961 RepID=B6SBG3_AMPCA|nr:major basic nuclear protein variant [Amphidinium carterae]
MLPKTKKTSAAKAKVMTQTEVYKIVAEKTGFARKQVKGAVDALMELSAEQVKKAGSFKVAGMLNMKLKSKPATKARKGGQLSGRR